MGKIRILSVLGTRPEVIKFVTMLLALQEREEFESIVCVTGQHREMLDQMLSISGIRPNEDLNLMRPNQTLGDVTAALLHIMPKLFEEYKPDRVLVQGDTTTAFAAALAAFYHHIPVGHIEAGLRSHNLYAPWPEEFNRKTIGSFADLHFVPTEKARANLLAERVKEETIVVTGNPVIDALHHFLDALENNEALRANVIKKLPFLDARKKLILVTAHRRESFDGGIERICKALAQIGDRGDVQIVFPVHLNPKVRVPVHDILKGHAEIQLMEPADYFTFIYLMQQAHLIISDSGGVQEEAPSLKKPVLVLRDTTERPEGVEAGVVKLVGTDQHLIVQEANKLLDDKEAYAAMQHGKDLYGDGNATSRMIEALLARHQVRKVA